LHQCRFSLDVVARADAYETPAADDERARFPSVPSLSICASSGNDGDMT
jgi:hypothetical protein